MLDIDQLLTTLQERPRIRAICHALEKFSPYKSLILGFHIHWKHRGDLNNLFPNPEEKEDFLKFMSQYCNDGIPRYFLPEIHFGSNKAYKSLIDDMARCFNFLIEKAIYTFQ